MKAEPVYREVWAASVVFFIANCWVLGAVLDAYDNP
jgi:hypothetical protein